MKKIWIAIFLALMLAGCRVQQEIKLDTIVDIPLNPTEEVTTAVTESQPSDETVPAETDTPAESTQVAEKTTSSKTSSKSSSGGSSTKTTSKKSGSNSTTKAAEATLPSTAPTEAPTQAPTEASEQPTEYDATGYRPGILDYGVIDAVNAQRTQAGLDPLSVDTGLCAIASARAYEISLSWSHARPDGSSFTTILTQYGCGFSTAAESIYNSYAAPSAEAIVSKWMGSDANRINILSENAVKIGVGTYTADDGAVYTAALFVG